MDAVLFLFAFIFGAIGLFLNLYILIKFVRMANRVHEIRDLLEAHLRQNKQ